MFWIIVLLLLVSYWWWTVPRGLPPGSSGIPILGYFPFLSRYIHVSFAELGKKYGNIFYLYIGSRLVLVLNDYKAAKEAFKVQAETFSGRPADAMFKDSKDDNYGISATDGEFWKQHRRFIATNLRDYGIGKLTLEPQLLEEIHYFINEIKKHNGKSFDAKQLVSYSLMNTIHIFLTGDRYDYSDPNIVEIQKIFQEFEEIANVVTLKMFFPWIDYIPGMYKLVKRKQARLLIEKFVKIVENVVKKAKNKYIDGDRDNYVQAYMSEKTVRGKSLVDEQIFTQLALLHNSRDMLGAGTETTATTLMFSILYLINYPEVQKKIQKEIDDVIGQERNPSYSDKSNMPFTEATIWEVHRIVSLVPIAIPHRNFKETTLFGYTIPKDTMTFINIWNIHHDPKLWGDPENFRPERFFNENGQLSKPEYLVPFSIGKRACVGEPLAQMELFLYLTSLLQIFDFIPPDGIRPSLEPSPGFSLQPKSRVVCVKPRSN